MCVPTLRMRDGHPAEEFRDLIVRSAFGPDDHVPMIGHHAIGENPQRFSIESLFQHAFKRSVIFVLLEQGCPRIGTVEDMIDQTTLNGTCSTWHLGILSAVRKTVKEGSLNYYRLKPVGWGKS